MGSFSPTACLSGSTNGRPIKVAATATPGTTIHTAVAGTTQCDELYMWVTNTSTSPVGLTIEFGGTTSPDDLVYSAWVVPPLTRLPILFGERLQNGLLVRAFASAANVLLITGWPNRIAL